MRNQSDPTTQFILRRIEALEYELQDLRALLLRTQQTQQQSNRNARQAAVLAGQRFYVELQQQRHEAINSSN